MNLGFQALIAVILGVACGFFFGPLCSILSPIGQIFVMLLQMAVLPYVPLSLMHGLGSLTPEIAKKLLRKGWIFIPLLWAIVLTAIYLLNILIPHPSVAIIKSHDAVDTTPNLLTYLIPQNLFYDLANNILPAVAVFGLILGTSMMLLKEKEPILSLLERLVNILERIFHWLALVSPIAIFIHIAKVVGTVNFEDLFKIQFYVIIVIIGTIFLTLWVLPAFVSSLGPFSFKEVLKASRSACLIAFATGVPTVAFPFMLDAIQRLMHRHGLHLHNLKSTSQTVIPLAYSFTQLGNFFLLFFVFFMSFFYRQGLDFSQKIFLPFLTMILSLGAPSSSVNAASFLMKNLQFPQGAMALFSETSAVTLNFQVLLSIASVMSFIILVMLGYYKLLKIRWKSLCLNLGAAFICFGLLMSLVKQYLHLKDNYRGLYMQMTMAHAIDNPVAATLLTTSPYVEKSPFAPLERILQDDVLRVGYDPRNIPFCYFNKTGELVGYDIACAYQMARDLDCRLEFIPANIDMMGEELKLGVYDIVMSAILMDEQRILLMDFCHPYMEQSNVLIVPREHADRFLHYDALSSNPALTIGASGGYIEVVKRLFPFAQLVTDTGTDSLLARKVDAIVWSRTPAFTWCLNHPEFSIIDFGGLLGQKYFAYPVQTNAGNWKAFVNNWMELHTQSGFFTKQQAYWLEGKLPHEEEPRWSILRNVLNWVK